MLDCIELPLHQNLIYWPSPHYLFPGFPGGSEGKASACNAGDPGLTPGLGRSPGEGHGNPLQNSCLENPMGGGAWWAPVHRIAKSLTWLSDFPSFLPFSLPFFLPSFFLSEGMVGDMCGRSLKVIEFILHADKTLKENENGDFKRNFWASYQLPEIADSSTEIDL